MLRKERHEEIGAHANIVQAMLLNKRPQKTWSETLEMLRPDSQARQE